MRLPEGVQDPRITGGGATPRRPPAFDPTDDGDYEEDMSGYIKVEFPDGDVVYVDPSLVNDAYFDFIERRLVIAYTPDEIRRSVGDLGW